MSDLSVIPLPPTHTDPVPETQTADPFRVSGLGSCRIMGPLRDIESRGHITLNQSAISGYVHSSAEVLCQFNHMKNATLPPPEVRALVAPGLDETSKPEHHETSEFYVFEISSAKQIRVHGHPVQLNYINKHFAAFFSDVERTRAFWAAARSQNERTMAAFLTPLPEFQSLCETDQQLLLGTQMTFVEMEALCRDIDRLKLAAPDHLFVTHFDAIAADGQPLKARAEFLEMLRTALNECGVTWYDPSAAVAAFGQDITLEDDARSLSHYAPSFETYLGSRWWDETIRPVCRERRLDADLRAKIKRRACAQRSLSTAHLGGT